jgi:hypothetical protein
MLVSAAIHDAQAQSAPNCQQTLLKEFRKTWSPRPRLHGHAGYIRVGFSAEPFEAGAPLTDVTGK